MTDEQLGRKWAAAGAALRAVRAFVASLPAELREDA